MELHFQKTLLSIRFLSIGNHPEYGSSGEKDNKPVETKNINFAAGFIVYKHSANYGAVYMFSYSDAYPVPMFARLVDGAWVDS